MAAANYGDFGGGAYLLQRQEHLLEKNYKTLNGRRRGGFLGNVQILIIDDMPDMLSSVVASLRGEGWRVSLATNGQSGFHRAQALLPDLILLDVRMPGMDGFATCRLLKESARTRAIPIIYLTVDTDSEVLLEGLRNGGVDYITKPCMHAELLARVRIHLLAGKRAAVSDAVPMPLLSDGEVMLKAALRLISDQLSDPPSLVELAAKVGTHDKKLSSIFRQHLGMTVYAWIREERMRVSREWLAETHMSIEDIASQVGFHSAANFATAFRRRLGVTPSQYRQNMRHIGPAAQRMAPAPGREAHR